MNNMKLFIPFFYESVFYLGDTLFITNKQYIDKMMKEFNNPNNYFKIDRFIKNPAP